MTDSMVSSTVNPRYGALGGGISLKLSDSRNQETSTLRGPQAAMQRCIVTNNRAPYGSGGGIGIALRSQVVDGSNTAALHLTWCVVLNNSASLEYGRGSNVYVHHGISLTVLPHHRHGSHANSTSDGFCGVGMEYLMQRLSRPSSRACRGMAYWPGDAGIVLVGQKLIYTTLNCWGSNKCVCRAPRGHIPSGAAEVRSGAHLALSTLHVSDLDTLCLNLGTGWLRQVLSGQRGKWLRTRCGLGV